METSRGHEKCLLLLTIGRQDVWQTTHTGGACIELHLTVWHCRSSFEDMTVCNACSFNCSGHWCQVHIGGAELSMIHLHRDSCCFVCAYRLAVKPQQKVTVVVLLVVIIKLITGLVIVSLLKACTDDEV